MEKALLQMEHDYELHEQQLADDKARFEDRLVARMSDRLGHGAVKEFYGANGSHAAEPAEVSDPTALRVKELREQRGWSQEQLAEKAGCSRSMVQRIEALGRGQDLGRVLNVLEHQP